eukprot:11224507-Lingulodinium_polyedra.AAC.1
MALCRKRRCYRAHAWLAAFRAQTRPIVSSCSASFQSCSANRLRNRGWRGVQSARLARTPPKQKHGRANVKSQLGK